MTAPARMVRRSHISAHACRHAHELLLRVGTAGWTVPRAVSSHFNSTGTHLQRFARLVLATEINSSFYRSHARSTYERWAALTPPFQFSVKVPRVITHEQRLYGSDDNFQRFLDETGGLGDRRGPLLLQLPPSLAFDPKVTRAFFGMVRESYGGFLACEPRHVTWFTRPATTLLLDYQISRVGADPPHHSLRAATLQAGQGSPKSAGMVPRASIGLPMTIRALRLAECLLKHSAHSETWCIFDNTASGAAVINALRVLSTVNGGRT